MVCTRSAATDWSLAIFLIATSMIRSASVGGSSGLERRAADRRARQVQHDRRLRGVGSRRRAARRLRSDGPARRRHATTKSSRRHRSRADERIEMVRLLSMVGM